MLCKLSKDIIDPIEIFQSNQSTIITETLEEFRIQGEKKQLRLYVSHTL